MIDRRYRIVSWEPGVVVIDIDHEHPGGIKAMVDALVAALESRNMVFPSEGSKARGATLPAGRYRVRITRRRR